MRRLSLSTLLGWSTGSVRVAHRYRRLLGRVEALERRELLASIAYITGPGDPWGSLSNDAAMNAAFGAGNWDKISFPDAIPTGVFSSGNYHFVFMDGGDGQDSNFMSFVSAHRPELEAWVSSGGDLFMNAARWTGGTFDLGFDSTLTGNDFSFPGTAVDPSHAIFNGPATPVGTSWSGNYFSHDSVSGTGLTPLIVNASGNAVLAEKDSGSGHLLLGGMTTTNFHSPQPEASNLLSNILVYAATSSDAHLSRVAPDPRTEPVPSVGVTFKTAIDPATFDYNDIHLTRNGGPDLITASVTVSQLSATEYVINGLASLTGTDGNYALSVTAGGIHDTGGAALHGTGTTRWVTDHQIPTLYGHAPLGGLIYDRSITRGLPATSDVQNLQISLDAGQTFSVLVEPTASLSASVAVKDPAATALGSGTAGPGQTVFLQSLPAASAGVERRSGSGRWPRTLGRSGDGRYVCPR